MRIILFRTYGHSKFLIVLCILHFLINFYIYQTIYSPLYKSNSLPSKFQKCFGYNSEDKVDSSFFFYVVLWLCVNAALNNSAHLFWSLIESIGVIKKMEEILLTEKEMYSLCCYISMVHWSWTNRNVIEIHTWVEWLHFFSNKYYFLSLLTGIWVKTHFPLKNPFAY